jgi:hypothetical protein
MGLKSYALVRSVIVLALAAAWCVSVCADLQIARQVGGAAAPGFEDADAEAYCFQRQADGCWPLATFDAPQVAARLDDH